MEKNWLRFWQPDAKWALLARDAVMDGTGDGVFVLDEQYRIADLNPVAQRIVGLAAAQMMGRPAAQVLSAWPQLVEHLCAVTESQTEITVGEGAARRDYELRVSSLMNPRGRPAGRLAILRDVTERNQVKILQDGIRRDMAERQQAEAELLAQKQLFENLVAVAHATAERPTVEATLQNALDVAATLTGAERGDLFLVNEAGVVTYSALAGGKVTHQRQDALGRVMNKGLAGWVARQRQSALVIDTSQDNRWLTLPGRTYTVRSALSVPIQSGTGLLGILTLTHPLPGHFTAEHLRLMQAAADQMALAVRNAQIFDAQRRTAEREMMMSQVLRAVSGQLDLEAVTRAAVQAISQFAGWPHVAIVLPDEDQRRWIARAASGLLSDSVGLTFPLGQGVIGRVFKTAQTQLVPDVSRDPDYEAGPSSIRSELAVPARRGERVLGVLDLVSERLSAFDVEDVLLAESLAETLALALDNARLYAEMRRHANNSSALYAIARMTSQTLALEQVIPQALSSAMSLLDFEAGLIALADPETNGGEARPGRLRLAVQRRLPPAQLESFQGQALEDTLCFYVYHQGENLVVGDLEQEAPSIVRHLASPLLAFGWRAYVGIPLLHQKRALGILCLFAHRTRSPSAYDMALLTTIGHQVATAVENARLFQDTLNERSRLQALIKSSHDGVILVGMEGRVLVVNARALQVLHLPGQPEDWLGRQILDALRALRVHAPNAVRAMLAEIRRVRKGDESPGEGELEVPPRVFHWSNLPVMAGAAPVGRLLILRDVTGERAVELMREDMTHTMVHDLRNPLTSIFSALEFLDLDAADTLSDSQRQVLEIAHSSTERMLNLVNSILDVSRLESGRMPVNRKSVPLGALLVEALRSQEPLAADKGLRLESDVPAGLPPAWADADLIRRVLQNLIGNAIKFTPTGGVIRVTARAEEGKKPLLLVSVGDTGPGIPTEIEGRLFQKFVTGRQRESGSGLGLAFCKLVVEAHDGRIGVESAPGQGATFTFSLPTSAPSILS